MRYKITRRTIYCFLALFNIFNALSQDPQFSQYYSVKGLLASSFAGTTGGGRMVLSYRDQWPQVPSEFITYNFYLDHYVPKYRSGVGLNILRDRAGSGKLISTNAAIQYAYYFQINRFIKAIPGFQVIYSNRSVVYNELVFGDQLSFDGNRPVSSEGHIFEPVNFFDFGASLLLFSDFFWLGGSYDHLPLPNASLTGGESKLPYKLTIFGGAKLITKQRLLLREQEYFYTSFLYKKQADFQQFDLGIYWERSPVQLGVWYRGLPIVESKYSYINQDAIVVKVGFFQENISLSYSYDYTLSGLRSFSGGAHEVSMVYLFNQNMVSQTKRKMQSVPCPKF